MLIRCPQCQTGYNLTPEKLGPNGRTVRCVKCENSWFQKPLEAKKPKEENAPIAPEPEKTIEDPLKPSTSGSSAVSSAKALFKRRMMITGFASFIGLLVIFSVLVLLKGPVESASPAMKGFYSAIGLGSDSMEGISVTGLSIPEESIERILDEDSTPVTYTFVGNVVNTNTVEVKIPQIRVSLLNEKGVEIDFWPAQVEKTSLKPGEKARWVCRFFNPPIDKIYEHRVHFAKP